MRLSVFASCQGSERNGHKNMSYFILVLKGIAMGLANAVPGVDGGTIAVITKVFDRFIDAITLNIKKLIKNLPFLLCIFGGMAIGIIIASFILDYLFENYNVPTQFFFIGIIIGSIPILYKECTAEQKLKPVHIIPFLLGAAAVILFCFINPDASSAQTEMNPIILFIISFIAAVCMIIPGFSGALIMKALGSYDLTIHAITEFNIPILLIIAVAVGLGILASARIISFLFKKSRIVTYCVIAGFILGSIPQVFPKEFAFNTQGIIAIFVLIIGMVIPTVMELPGKHKKKTESSSVNT